MEYFQKAVNSFPNSKHESYFESEEILGYESQNDNDNFNLEINFDLKLLNLEPHKKIKNFLGNFENKNHITEHCENIYKNKS